jgi:flagellar protein FlgJ
MTPLNLTSDFALDVNAVTKLKHTARQNPNKTLTAAARQFEALFLQKMLKSMRDAIPKSGLLDNAQSKTYQQMLDGQWAQILAKRGIGLADMLTRQLRGTLSEPAANTDGDKKAKITDIARAKPRPLGPSVPLAPSKPAAQPVHTGPLFTASQPIVALIQPPAAPESVRRKQTPDYVSRFIKRLEPEVAAAARATGLPKRLILAQAALESGWGRHEIASGDGKRSYNVFNIKAGGWNGPRVDVATTEYHNGHTQAARAGFRVYDSYAAAFADYVRLLQDSPRYAPVLAAPTAKAAAHALQACGFATDPNYGDKLVAIMAELPSDQIPAAKPLVNDKSVRPLIKMASATENTPDDRPAAPVRDAAATS